MENADDYKGFYAWYWFVVVIVGWPLAFEESIVSPDEKFSFKLCMFSHIIMCITDNGRKLGQRKRGLDQLLLVVIGLA